jgi:hypothetical protein
MICYFGLFKPFLSLVFFAHILFLRIASVGATHGTRTDCIASINKVVQQWKKRGVVDVGAFHGNLPHFGSKADKQG